LQSYPTTVLNENVILGVKTYSDPSYIFSGGQDSPTPMIYAPGININDLMCTTPVVCFCYSFTRFADAFTVFAFLTSIQIILQVLQQQA